MRLHSRLLLLLLALPLGLTAQTIADHSVLSQGTWYKLGIVETGLYKLDLAYLNSIGFNTSGIDPRHIQIYGNGGGMLPQANNVAVHDDLVENAIHVEGEADGSFDTGDFVLFYAEGPHQWDYDEASDQFRHQFNLYADTNYYFITLGAAAGKRVLEAASPNASPTYTLSAAKGLAFHERDLQNPIHSGRYWLGEKFDLSLQREFALYMGDLANEGEIHIEIQLSARSDVSTRFRISSGATLLDTINFKMVDFDNSEARNYQTRKKTFSLSPSLIGTDDSLRFQILYEKGGSVRSEGWLDWFELVYDRALSINGQSEQTFALTQQIGPNEIAEIKISGVKANTKLWDITDPLGITALPYSLNATTLTANLATENLKNLLVFNSADLLPVSNESLTNQDLHGSPLVDYIIISYPAFRAEAERLAQFHEDHYQRSTLVVSPQEIYNEFSSGRADVTALRNFIRMFYRRSAGMSPGFVCLFGDGTYNHKKHGVVAGIGEINFVPTYQSFNSWDPTTSYVSDDFYGLLEDHEGIWGEGSGRPGDAGVQVNTIDVPIGRLPIISVLEAEQLVDKIIRYATNPAGVGFGAWRNRVLLVADHKPGERADHMQQSDGYSSPIRAANPCINIDKIFMDNYPMEITAGKSRFPEGRKALLTALDRGSLIVNYTGHGGEFAWSNSRILENSDIGNMLNHDKLPAVITATCEFGRFDNPDLRSGAELMVLEPNLGAIAMFTTVRLVFSGPNETLNQNFYNYVLSYDPDKGRMPTIGEVMMHTKNETFKDGSFTNLNSRNFTLLGDPGLILNYPQLQAKITRINGQDVQTASVDTLRSLSRIRVIGIIEDAAGNPLPDFSGEMQATVFDKPSRFVTRLFPSTFYWQKNRLFNGTVSVENGAFAFEFVVPIDISYEEGLGKISLYFHNEDWDGAGCYDQLQIGGTASNAIVDTEGPKVQLYLNDHHWQDGGITGDEPYLYAEVFDQNGINTGGVGIGHEITATLDEAADFFVLNDYYQSKIDSYQEGIVRYQLKELADGPHTLKIRVWDVANNFAEDETNFIVTTDPVAALEQVLNYPNPFSGNATTFLINHNLDGKDVKLQILISTLNGQVVKVLEEEFYAVGNVYKGIDWNGQNEQGSLMSSGVYIYRVMLEDKESGQRVEAARRMILLRP
ncbi:MAG: type IX secretion system sortase PorU [Bacteroidota bacterium]